MTDCLFCRIIEGEIPSAKVYEDDCCYAFRDIQPMAPVHILVVPKKHVAGMAETQLLSDRELAALLRACAKIAEQEHLSDGYRVVTNCGKNARQSVRHLHFHLLGGKQLGERMD